MPPSSTGSWPKTSTGTTCSRSAEGIAMSHEYRATVRWARDRAAFTDNKYSRAHIWGFDGGLDVPASSSPSSVRLPYSREDAVDPEEGFVASIASCHMLFFLSFAAKAGFVV